METIEDIVKEMREYLTSIGTGECVEEDAVESFADRIEKAHRREVELLKKCVSGECDRISVGAELCSDCPFAEIDYVRTENERLKAALKPVLECDRYSCDCGAEYAVKCSSAVNDAQRIWKEGDK